MSSEQQRHKAGPLKQKNKSHKYGRHRTKGLIDNANRGKVDVKVITKKNRILSKQEKRHQAKQIRKNKREEILEKKRKLGSINAAPHVVALFSLSHLCSSDEALAFIKESDDSIICHQKGIATTISSKRHKQRYTVLAPEQNDLYGILDSAKVADSFLFIVPTTGDIDEFSETCLTCLISQGLVPSMHVIQGMKHIPQKKQSDVRKAIMKKLEKWFPEIKLHSLDNTQDGGFVLRQMTNQKQKRIYYRDHRPYLLADRTEFIAENKENNKTSTGILKVFGYLRGRGLSPNALVHLPGLGDFQMKQIDLPTDPNLINVKERKKTYLMDDESNELMEEDLKVFATADPNKQESLQIEAEVDPMEGEQTWPTEQELLEADEANKIQRSKTKVPKGTSEYQASWIVPEHDEDGEDNDFTDDDEYEEDEDGDHQMFGFDEEDDSQSEGDSKTEEFDTMSVSATTTANDDKYDDNFDMQEEQKQLKKYREERENDMFPDEVDTPMDVPARERFLRYRGLKSFRTSPWDPKENLPLDYARIFQFQNFNRTKKKILKKEDDNSEDKAQPGWYVAVHICNVPQLYFENMKKENPFVLFGLLPHEQKMTVMNYVIKRRPSLDIPIKAKDRLILHVGYRRFSCSPIFSQHTTGNKFKAERFLKQNTTIVATTYAPITFPSAPVLVFTEDHQLLATGTVLNSNPDRIIVKKIVLSGHPCKINKKSSVVRYMFFNRDDILWFKPVEIHTKYGRRGHIKEPLGTHGHMKCVFDGQLKAQDTVCMNLFKRIYPKWTIDYNITIPEHLSTKENKDGDVAM